MSSIVFLALPAHGHLNPMLPVMRELVRRGERVACFSTHEFRPQIERAGAAFRPYPATDLSPAAIATALEHGNIARVTALLLRSTEQLLPVLLDQLGRDVPDLVVFDSTAVWGKMAATALGVPGAASISHLVMDVQHMTKRDLLRILWLHLPEVPGILRTRRRLARRFGRMYPTGRPLFPMRDRLNLVFTTRELQPATPIIDGTFRFIGPSIDPHTRGESLDDATVEKGRLVYVALGTVHPMQPRFFRTCVEAFAGIEAQFLVSVGQTADIGAFAPVPANFVIRPAVPQLDVLARTSAFVTHAGINGVHEALYYGVPLVLVPQHFEQLFNARSVAARGAGIVIDARVRGKPVTPRALRGALTAVLSEPRYREAAAALRVSMRAGGGYVEAANHLQAYVGASRSPAAQA